MLGGAARKASGEMERVLAKVPRGRMVLNLTSTGEGSLGRQMDCSLWVDLDGWRMLPTAHEAWWRLPVQWA